MNASSIRLCQRRAQVNNYFRTLLPVFIFPVADIFANDAPPLSRNADLHSAQRTAVAVLIDAVDHVCQTLRMKHVFANYFPRNGCHPPDAEVVQAHRARRRTQRLNRLRDVLDRLANSQLSQSKALRTD
jgi:hypothetical protein